MRIEELRSSRKGATVIFMKLTNLKEKFSNSLFCCFEGDDAKYYFKRIEDYTKYLPENIIVLNCEGKSEVVRLYNLVNQKTEYRSLKFLYFVDKDFDPPIDKSIYVNLYETPVYSIENLYTTKEAFIRVLKCEFNYMDIDPEYIFLIQAFSDRQKEFHLKTTYFNAWLACQREKSSQGLSNRLNLSSFNLNKIVPRINLDSIQENYNKIILESLFPEAYILTEEEIQLKIAEFNKHNPQEIFRGKFELDFLFSFLEAIKIELNLPQSRLKKKSGVQINQSKRNMISEFSQYASTMNCLILFLKGFLAI